MPELRAVAVLSGLHIPWGENPSQALGAVRVPSSLWANGSSSCSSAEEQSKQLGTFLPGKVLRSCTRPVENHVWCDTGGRARQPVHPFYPPAGIREFLIPLASKWGFSDGASCRPVGKQFLASLPASAG